MNKSITEGTTQMQSIASAFIGIQLLLHLIAFVQNPDLRSGFLHFLAFQYDIVFILTICAILARFKDKIPRIEVITSLIFLVLPLYPLLMDEFMAFPVNIFSSDVSLLPFFLVNIAGFKSLIISSFSLLTAAFFYRRRLSYDKWPFGYYVKSAFIIAFAGLAVNVARAEILEVLPNPYTHGIVQTIKEAFVSSKRVVPELQYPIASQVQTTDEPSETCGPEKFFTARYEKIVILVMETVNHKDFARELEKKSFRFYEMVKDRCLVFNNYFTTNLDSYTSLISMLTEEQVPYRAYENPGFFKNVNTKNGPVSMFRANGWKTMFVCSSLFQPFVPVEQSWDMVLHGKDLPDDGQWKKLGQNAVEAGIEDKAALSTILKFVDENQKAMVMHEMVYGHSPRWMALTQKSQLEYYDEFFCDLYKGLEKRGIADKTLLLVLADHGSRAKSDEKEFYQVPLLIIGDSVKSGISEEMYSHLDLTAFIQHYVLGCEFPKPREKQLVIGHTGRWTYGCINADKSAVFLDAKSGAILGSGNIEEAMATHQMMQNQINYFARFQLPRAETPKSGAIVKKTN